MRRGVSTSHPGGSAGHGARRRRDPEMEPTRRVRVDLAGCGTVGSAFVRILEERRATAPGPGPTFDLGAVLVRDPARPRAAPLDGVSLTTEPATLMESEADIVVEAMGGIDLPLELARASLGRGAPYITANKALVAVHGPDLHRLARRNGSWLRFEAAVGGGIPVVRVLRDALAPAGIIRLTGILNGTTNYILSRMEDGLGFEAALGEARRKGLAEADPARDLDGRDVADKIAILAWQAFGVAPADVELTVRGILPDPDGLVARARRAGDVVRLVARCEPAGAGVRAVIEPVAVPPASALGRTRDEGNLVEIETRRSGTHRLTGPGAGGGPTASALLADLLEVA